MKTKEFIKDKGNPFTIDTVKEAANALIAAAIGKNIRAGGDWSGKEEKRGNHQSGFNTV